MSFEIDKSRPDFIRLKALNTYAPGDIIIDLTDATLFDQPDYTTIDLLDRHVYHPIGRYINHSCSPNAVVDQKKLCISAQHHIQPGDEITFDYLRTERQIMAPFDCQCGAKNCIERVEKSPAI